VSRRSWSCAGSATAPRTRIEQLGRDHGVSRATAYRYVDEGTEVLAAQAPDLHQALERAREQGVPFVILDGRLFASDRVAEQVTSVKGDEIDAWYSGKHRRPGGNVQAVMRPDGLPLWTSGAEPGHVHDITAARVRVLPALYRAAALGMPALADCGYDGAGIGPSRRPTQLLTQGLHRIDPRRRVLADDIVRGHGTIVREAAGFRSQPRVCFPPPPAPALAAEQRGVASQPLAGTRRGLHGPTQPLAIRVLRITIGLPSVALVEYRSFRWRRSRRQLLYLRDQALHVRATELRRVFARERRWNRCSYSARIEWA
jgi:hypothetical protein